MIKNDLSVRVARVDEVAENIKRFRLEPANDQPLPVFSGGAHVVVAMQDYDHIRRNAYSLMSDPADTSAYEISVLRVPHSRGGSIFMHERVKAGDLLSVSQPVNLFQPDWRGHKHILVAGGIGITPFLSMMAQFDRESIPFELHYAVRSRGRAAYASELSARYGHRVKIYVDEEGASIPLDTVLARQPLGTHLYVCGPSGMIDGVLKAGIEAGWPAHNLHSERFLAPPPGQPFVVDLARRGSTVPVGAHESILEALEAAGVDAPYLCRGGACGQCETGVVGCDGAIQHNDVFLTDEEKTSGKKIMICVSRFEGARLQLDL